MRIILLLILAAGITACSSPPPDDTAQRFSAFLNRQIGKPEADLVRAFRRMPDANYQQDPRTRMLMWRMEATFTTPGTSPDYVAIPGAGIVPVGGTAPTSRKEYCNVEWHLIDGKASAWNMVGKGCP